MMGVGATDGQLLESFVSRRDSGAFRDLMSRHGPSVLRVCRGVLHDSHAADDAFQATFLVLVRKAPAIQDPERLGGWLRGVAYRTAVRARSQAARRRVVETSRKELRWIDPPPEESKEELQRVMGDELARLPDLYRQAVTLCYLEGLTHQEAASRLGWPVGTVKVRLVRARRLLQERLNRRGIGWGAGLLLVLRYPGEVSATPDVLVESTIRAMQLAAAGRRAALHAQFGHALALAEAVLGVPIGRAAWSWAVVAVAGVFVALTGPAVLAFYTPAAPAVNAASLPKNLTDVLTVDCR